jgi:hypothetical protein
VSECGRGLRLSPTHRWMGMGPIRFAGMRCFLFIFLASYYGSRRDCALILRNRYLRNVFYQERRLLLLFFRVIIPIKKLQIVLFWNCELWDSPCLCEYSTLEFVLRGFS